MIQCKEIYSQIIFRSCSKAYVSKEYHSFPTATHCRKKMQIHSVDNIFIFFAEQ